MTTLRAQQAMLVGTQRSLKRSLARLDQTHQQMDRHALVFNSYLTECSQRLLPVFQRLRESWPWMSQAAAGMQLESVDDVMPFVLAVAQHVNLAQRYNDQQQEAVNVPMGATVSAEMV